MVVDVIPAAGTRGAYANATGLSPVGGGVDPAKVLLYTPHLEKATVVHWGVRLGAPTRALPAQGGWRSKEDSLPLQCARKLGRSPPI